MKQVTIGILALQGGFALHASLLRDIGCSCRQVREPAQLQGIAGLIIPGGESTTIWKLMARVALEQAIGQAHQNGLPIFGTCAGAILMARRIVGSDQPSLALMDIAVRRNAYGRQYDSFEADITGDNTIATPEAPLRGVFIRAPIIVEHSAAVEVLASFERRPVLVRQGSMLATTFHPELTSDHRIHRLFVELCDTSQ